MMRAAFSIVARDFLGLNMGAEPGRARAVDDAGRAVGMMFKLSAELHRLPDAAGQRQQARERALVRHGGLILDGVGRAVGRV